MKLIKKSAMAIIKDNKLLVVRAKGSSYFLMPGGKPKGDESAIAALKREIMEELGCGIDESSLVYLGNFEDFTSDREAKVSIDLYSGKLIGTPKASAEIDELVWITAADSKLPQLTPVIKNKILPFLVRKKLLP